LAASMLKHQHVKNTRSTVRFENGEQRTIFIIETDMALNPCDPAYDADAFRNLEMAAHQYLEQHPNYAEFRIRPAPKDTSA
jgi:hypothetical protein